MKSSWELALERTGGKLSELSHEKKASLAAIDAKYRSKIAEAELSLQNRLAKEQDPAKIDEMKQGLVLEIASLKDKLEREKEAARKA